MNYAVMPPVMCLPQIPARYQWIADDSLLTTDRQRSEWKWDVLVVLVSS